MFRVLFFVCEYGLITKGNALLVVLHGVALDFLVGRFAGQGGAGPPGRALRLAIC